MSIFEQLATDIVTALKAHEAEKLLVLRMLKNSIDLKIKEGAEPSDQLVIATAQAEVKKRQDAINLYQQAGATDKAKAEESEIGILKNYLPQPLSPEEVETFITEAITSTGAVSAQDMGKVMSYLKEPLNGRADMSSVSQLVRDKLNQ